MYIILQKTRAERWKTHMALYKNDSSSPYADRTKRTIGKTMEAP